MIRSMAPTRKILTHSINIWKTLGPQRAFGTKLHDHWKEGRKFYTEVVPIVNVRVLYYIHEPSVCRCRRVVREFDGRRVLDAADVRRWNTENSRVLKS
jgi:hypothetical protein